MLKSPVETPKKTGSAWPHMVFDPPPHTHPATCLIKGSTLVSAQRLRGSGYICRPSTCFAFHTGFDIGSDAGAMLWKVIRYHHSFINLAFLVSGWLCGMNGSFHAVALQNKPRWKAWLGWVMKGGNRQDNSSRSKIRKTMKDWWFVKPLGEKHILFYNCRVVKKNVNCDNYLLIVNLLI